MNTLNTLVRIRGLQDHTTATLDTVDIAAGETRTLEFRVGRKCGCLQSLIRSRLRRRSLASGVHPRRHAGTRTPSDIRFGDTRTSATSRDRSCRSPRPINPSRATPSFTLTEPTDPSRATPSFALIEPTDPSRAIAGLTAGWGACIFLRMTLLARPNLCARRIASLWLLAVAAVPATAQQSTSARQNPLFRESALPFQAPPFDKIRNSDYQPAIEEGIRQELAAVLAIANQTAPATFQNTIVALENTGALLERAQVAFAAVTRANTNDTLQAAQSAVAPKLAAHNDAIYMNAALFRRVRSIYDRRDALKLTAEQKRVVERYHSAFLRAGAQLSESDQTRLRALNAEESKLSTEFNRRLLAATKAGGLVVDDAGQLAGLSDGDIASAAAAAQQRGLEGKWVLPLQNTTQQPAQVSLQNRAVRQRLFEASIMRAQLGDANDTREIIQRMARIRAERAAVMGYKTFAAFQLADQSAQTPEAAIKLLTDMAPPAREKARGEAAMMQALIDKQGGGFTLQPWDWQYYAEQVRKAQYDFDAAEARPYLELNRVLQDGVFYAANQMYGLTFRERKDIPVYHPDVRVFEVFEQDGKHLALFYGDFFKRDNKRGGAWMGSLVGQSKLRGTSPVVYNVTNFPKPAAGQPALLTFEEASTMFHEFGHALHGMFSNVTYPLTSFTNVPRDFVEMPSHFNEHWAMEPRVFARYARHYQTGAAIPAALADKIRTAATFNQGFELLEYLEASLLDMGWHTLPPDAPALDVDARERMALEHYQVYVAEVPPRYRSTYFSHIWGGNYSAAYYAYLWSQVYDNDAYAWFKEHGGMTRANGQRFRDMVLSRGSTQEASALYRAFAGRDPSVEPLLEHRGLKPR